MHTLLTDSEYAELREICDKANAYWKTHANFDRNGASSMSNALCAHPDYAACTNEIRGKVEQYELNRDKPARFSAYIGGALELTTWTGEVLSRVLINGRPRRNKGYVSAWRCNVNVLTIWGDWYCGISLGKGICINLRRMKHAPRA